MTLKSGVKKEHTQKMLGDNVTIKFPKMMYPKNVKCNYK